MNPLANNKILHWSKLKAFADNKMKLIINNARKFSFSHSVFKRLIPQTHKNQGLFGKGLTKNLQNLPVQISPDATKSHQIFVGETPLNPLTRLVVGVGRGGGGGGGAMLGHSSNAYSTGFNITNILPTPLKIM